ncbi:hypothetical protein DRO97_04680 [Archaeoglobales archaeon]|nr:MAG: hypothetical protein DRO97_04680 [Archaeoglobales archaeon]
MNIKVNISEISTYAFCPRLLYFRLKFGDDDVTETHAAREIYLSKRKGFDNEWAFERFKQLYGESNAKIFAKAFENFKYNSILDEFKPVEWEIKLESGKLKLKGILDEIVLFNGKELPLILALRKPEKDVWFKDLVKITAFCMLLDVNEGLVYYCFDGELKRVEVTRKEKYQVLKLIERVLKVRKGFVPERREGGKCNRCRYLEACNSEPSTFASKFL